MIQRHLIRGALIALLGGHALTAAMTAPAAAQAPGPPVGHEPGMHRPMGRTDGDLWLLIRSANLTPEQQTKVREILSAHRSTARPLIEQLRQAQQELGEFLGSLEAQAARFDERRTAILERRAAARG